MISIKNTLTCPPRKSVPPLYSEPYAKDRERYMATNTGSNARACVGVYSPYLQGPFLGELISQIHQYCLLKNYRFSLIKTDGFGRFQTDIHSDCIDYCIILRNALHPQLVESLVDRGKAVVSIAYDYFPLNVPVISSDNFQGVKLAFQDLLSKQHQYIAFVGDLSNYDIRKRYEGYCEQLDILGHENNDANVFMCADEYFSSGFKAATEYIKSNCQATGIICGSGLTGIGFYQQMKHLVPHRLNSIDIVSFDANSLIPFCAPKMSVIDQNLHLMAYRAIQVVENIASGDHVDRVEFTEPKIITENTEYRDSDEAFLATSVEIRELHNANYIKSVLGNLYEWPKTIVEDKLESIMMLSPLFSRHLETVCLARIQTIPEGNSRVNITRLFTAIDDKSKPSAHQNIQCDLNHYPYSASGYDFTQFASSIHLPISYNDQVWGVLSVFSNHHSDDRPSSMSGLFAYLDHIVSLFHLSLEKGASLENSTPERHSHQQSGKISWDTQSNEFEWDDKALALLGFTSDLEKNIYRTMELSDRIHEDNELLLQQALKAVSSKGLFIEIDLKHKNRHYKNFQLNSPTAIARETLIINITPVTKVV